MKNRVLVFGGNGFLGQYLVAELTERGYITDVADLLEIDNFKGSSFFSVDIMNEKKVHDTISGGKYDYVYNLAGFANLDNAIDHPKETIELNVIGNINIMEGCLKGGIKRFIYASSAYAMSNKGSFYGISKLASEKLIEEYKRRHNLSFTILRYGSVYSELPFDNNYIYKLIEKAVNEKEINHNGSGQELREYIHASDAAKLSVDVIEDEKFSEMHVILTGNEKMRRLELFELIKEILDEDLKIFLNDKNENHHYQYTPYSFQPSVSRKLIANPHIDMGQGILECIRSVHNKKN